MYLGDKVSYTLILLSDCQPTGSIAHFETLYTNNLSYYNYLIMSLFDEPIYFNFHPMNLSNYVFLITIYQPIFFYLLTINLSISIYCHCRCDSKRGTCLVPASDQLFTNAYCKLSNKVLRIKYSCEDSELMKLLVGPYLSRVIIYLH